MITSNLPLVGYLVSQVMAGATHLSREDLAQAGALALVKAVDSFDESRGVPFSGYARQVILGGIRDEMRADDWAKRSTRTAIKAAVSAQEVLTSALGRTPTTDEIAGALGVDRKTAAESMAMSKVQVSSIDEAVTDFLASDAEPTDAGLLARERLDYLRMAVESLPARLQYIVVEVYLNERPLGEIAEELGVTHSAVSQQRAEAIRLMRDGLSTHYGEVPDEKPAAARSARREQYLGNFSRAAGAYRPTLAAMAS